LLCRPVWAVSRRPGAALVDMTVVEQRYRAVLAVERGEPKQLVPAQFRVSRQTLPTGSPVTAPTGWPGWSRAHTVRHRARTRCQTTWRWRCARYGAATRAGVRGGSLTSSPDGSVRVHRRGARWRGYCAATAWLSPARDVARVRTRVGAARAPRSSRDPAAVVALVADDLVRLSASAAPGASWADDPPLPLVNAPEGRRSAGQAESLAHWTPRTCAPALGGQAHTLASTPL
jgi:hypothetical protein